MNDWNIILYRQWNTNGCLHYMCMFFLRTSIGYCDLVISEYSILLFKGTRPEWHELGWYNSCSGCVLNLTLISLRTIWRNDIMVKEYMYIHWGKLLTMQNWFVILNIGHQWKYMVSIAAYSIIQVCYFQIEYG